MYELKKGKYTLTHERLINDMGFECDYFDLFDEENRVHYPFRAGPKVSSKGADFPINKIPYEYTKEDYEEMLDEQIKRFEDKK